MCRRLIPLAVAVVLVLGCKKKEEGGGGGGGADDGKTDGDPNAAYTIKLREPQKGDKTEETESETGTGEVTIAGKGEKEKQDKRLEYTETIIEKPDTGKPTKLTRTYKTAQRYDKKAGATKSLPYEGKTVAIEKKGSVYEFTADGKRMNFVDSADFAREFSKPDGKSKLEALLPKQPVKVGESWPIDLGGLKALGGDVPFPLDMDKSKLTGKLTRAYTKDGKQWGVIALDCDLVVDTSKAGGKPKAAGSATGTIKMNGTLDTVIDGSSRDGVLTVNVKMDVIGKEGPAEVKVAADMVVTKTTKTLK